MANAAIECPLKLVPTGTRSFDDYRPYASEEQFDQVRDRAVRLRGLRLIEINSTPRGGGVATMLQSIIPVLTGLGLDVQWYSMCNDRAFFDVTKKLAYLLQGGQGTLTHREVDCYLKTSELLARQVEKIAMDLLLIDDPQPAAIPGHMRRAPDHGSMWHGHIDLSQPNPDALAFFQPLLQPYRLVVLEVEAYRLPGIPEQCQRFIPDAIDPLARKNQQISRQVARRIMARVGMNPAWPAVAQVARFDPWKNPIGVVDAYREARRRIPNLQLALLGTFVAQDDPTAEQEYQKVKQRVGDDPLVHLFTNPKVIGQAEVDAFQTGSDAILLFSCREGFGLAATEAMWKCNAVIAGGVPGLRAQITDGVNGFLVNTVDECADRIVRLVHDRDLAYEIGQRAHQTVCAHFLLPRLIDDWLGIFEEMVTLPRTKAA